MAGWSLPASWHHVDGSRAMLLLQKARGRERWRAADVGQYGRCGSPQGMSGLTPHLCPSCCPAVTAGELAGGEGWPGSWHSPVLWGCEQLCPQGLGTGSCSWSAWSALSGSNSPTWVCQGVRVDGLALPSLQVIGVCAFWFPRIGCDWKWGPTISSRWWAALSKLCWW